MTNKPQIVREYEELNKESTNFNSDEIKELKEFAQNNTHDKQGKYRPALELRNGKLKAQNYVGIIQTRKGKVLEILPKVDFSDGDDDATQTKQVFLQMLRTWRNIKYAKFNESSIRALQKFTMLEIFVQLFLENLIRLTKRGLAKHYQLVEENLPCLKGRILFPQHTRENHTNRARFYVQYDDFNANRPANRLIHSTINKLKPLVQQAHNQQLLHQMKIYFNDIPVSKNHDGDWRKHKVDRAMQHYQAVMQWVGLFLFGQGLATFSGKHIEHCLLFPMEQIFEDFVVHSFHKYQNHFTVKTQDASQYLAETDGKKVFQMRPDITLQNNQTKFILDTKWKRINENDTGLKHDIRQSDMYQLFSYGKKHDCKTVALIYPQTKYFKERFLYKIDNNLRLLCLPFDVAEPETSVTNIIKRLQATA